MEQLVWMTPGLRESAKSLSAWREPRMINVRQKMTADNIKRMISQVVLLTDLTCLASENIIFQSAKIPVCQGGTFIVLFSLEVGGAEGFPQAAG